MRKKICFIIIWFILILIGAFTYKYIPQSLQYSYGFFFGTFSLCSLIISKIF